MIATIGMYMQFPFVRCALAGMRVCILGGTPVGSTIAAANIVVYIAFCLTDLFKGQRSFLYNSRSLREGRD